MTGDAPLVLGAGGQVGSAFLRRFPAAVAVTRQEMDLGTAGPEDIRRLLLDARPAAVINCAAYTAVDRAESEETLATRINGDVVGWMAQVATDIGVPLLTFSTDYVFDGNGNSPYLESHPTAPINAYGRSKLVGEQAALRVASGALIVRTSWVLSTTHRNFVTAILARAGEGQPFEVVDDQVGCPTVADDLARCSWAALEAGTRGLLHLTNQGPTTWFELARTAVELAGMDRSLVRPCPTSDYPTPARRPAYSVLGSEIAGPSGLEVPPHWRDSIEPVVAGSLGLLRR